MWTDISVKWSVTRQQDVAILGREREINIHYKTMNSVYLLKDWISGYFDELYAKISFYIVCPVMIKI